MKKIHLICNSHIDPVWMWDWEEGLGEAISTFHQAELFCREFDFVFNHNEAVLYEFVREHDPELFDRIAAQVKAGKWHIMGGWYLQPDVVSIMIGINDVWHHAADRSWIPDEAFEERYRTVLQALREKTHAKIMMIEPFLIPVVDKLYFREDLYRKIEIERKLAREYADVYMPTDGLLASAFIGDDPVSYAADGVHPTAKGAEYIGKLYCEYMKRIIDTM